MSFKHKFMYKLIVFVFLQCLIANVCAQDVTSDKVSSGLGDQLWDYLTVGASVTAGVGGRATTVDVTRMQTGDHGKLIESREDALFLLYNTKASYFGESNVGYTWLFNLSTFKASDQELPDKSRVNLGTEVDGYFAYVVPTVFYNFGDRYRGHYFRTGIGLGIGWADFDGDIILTESALMNDQVSISNGPSNVFLALGLFVDYQWQNFTIRLSSAGPNLDDSGNDINISDTNIVLGYTYYLEN